MNFTNSANIIKAAVQVILVLFGLFGSVLLKVSPPEYNSNLKMATGIAMFISLLLFLFISVLLNMYAKKNQRGSSILLKIWLGIIAVFIIVFIVFAMNYYTGFNKHTLWQNKWEARFIRGDSLTTESLQICSEQNPKQRNCEMFLLNNYYTSDEIAFQNLLWTEASVDKARNNLFTKYIILIIALSGALFSLVEIISLRLQPAGEGKTSKTKKKKKDDT